MQKTMLAVCINGKADGLTKLERVDVPPLRDDQILVKVVVAAANPIDAKSRHFIKKVAISGCDFAGIVTEIGANANASIASDDRSFKVGDRVAGFVHGNLEMNGSYSEYVNACPWTTIKIPDSWSFENAAQIGACGLTAFQALYQSQTGLPFPDKPISTPIDLLVWSGSSSVGHFTIQLAKQAGLRVITTASPKHFDFLKNKLGVDEVFDYRDPEVCEKIRACTEGGKGLRYAVDCISEGGTIEMVSKCMREGTVISGFLPPSENLKLPSGVQFVWSLAYKLFGRPFDSPAPAEAEPGMVEFSRKSIKILERFVAEGKIIPAPVKLFPNGLAGVKDAFEYIMSGKVSGEKVIVRISDTPGIQV